jgi:hypothetical protein
MTEQTLNLNEPDQEVAPQEELPSLNFDEPLVGKSPLKKEHVADRTARYALALPEEPLSKIQDRVTQRAEDELDNIVHTQVVQQVNKDKEDYLRTRLAEGNLTPEEVQAVSSFGTNKTPHQSFMDKMASTLSMKAFSNVDGILAESSRKAAEGASEDEVLGEISEGQKIAVEAAKRSLGYKEIMEDLDADLEQQGFFGDAADLLGQMVPGTDIYEDYTNNAKPFNSSWLVGNSREEQRRYLLSLPADEAVEVVKRVVDELKEDNLFRAKEFMNDIVAANFADTFYNNAFTILDAADVATLGAPTAVKLAGRASKKLRRKRDNPKLTPAQKAGQDQADALADPDADVADVVAASGDLDGAGTIRGVQRIIDQDERAADIFKQTPMLARPDAEFAGSSKFAGVRGERISAELSRFTDNVLDATVFGGQPSQLPEELIPQRIELAKQEIAKNYNLDDHRIINAEFNTVESTNIDQIDIFVGKKDGTSFANEQSAKTWAKLLGFKNFELYNKGLGDQYLIRVKTDAPTNTPEIWQMLRTEGAAASQTEGLLNQQWIRRVIGGSNALSAQNRRNFDSVTHTSTRVLHYMGEEYKNIEKSFKGLGYDGFDRVRSIMNQGAAHVNKKDGVPGKWYKPDEFVDEYYKKYGHSPSDAEVTAYAKHIIMNDLDYFIRNTGVVRDMKGQGVKKVTLTEGKGPINAVPIDNPPWASMKSRDRILEIDEKGKAVLWNAGTIANDPEKLKQLKEYRAFRNYEPTWRKDDGEIILKDIHGENDAVDFILTAHKVEVDEIDFRQLPYREGGHQIYKSDWTLKQLSVTKEKGGRDRVDDNTLLAIKSEEEGMLVQKAYREAQKITREILEKEKKGLNTDAERAKLGNIEMLPYSPTEWLHAVKSKKIDVDAHIGLTRGGQALTDTAAPGGIALSDISEFAVRYDPRSNTKNLDTRFFGERHSRIDGLEYPGSEANPILNRNGAETLDAYSAISSQFENIALSTKGKVAEDAAIRSWLVENWELLEGAKSLDEVLRSPMHWYGQKLRSDKDLSDRVSRAKHNQRLINNLTNRLETYSSGYIHRVNQRIKDLAFRGEKAGKNKFLKSDWEISEVGDPFQYMRDISFTLRFSFWNPRQYYVQIQGMTNVHAFVLSRGTNPGDALKRSQNNWRSVYSTHRLMNRGYKSAKPSVVKSEAKRMEDMGVMKASEFEEGYYALEKSGWSLVGREVGDLNTQMNKGGYSGAKSKLRRASDWGTTPFKWGEGWVRDSAYWLAYTDWVEETKNLVKQGKPKRKLTQDELNKILTKANDFSNNMTRTGNAEWQKGYLSAVAQYSGFILRHNENYFGKRLTGREKRALFAMHTIVYGLPTASTGVIGIPYGLAALGINKAVDPTTTGDPNSDFRNLLRVMGVNPDDGVADFISNGLVANLWEWATGDEVDIGPDLGPGQLPILTSLAEGGLDFETLSTIGGQDTYKLLSKVEPVAAILTNVAMGQPSVNFEENMIDIISAATTFNNATKAYLAFRYGMITSATTGRRQPIENMGVMEKALIGIGLNPRRLGDAFDINAHNKLFQQSQKQMKDEAAKYLRRAAVQDGEDAAQNIQKAGDILANAPPGMSQKLMNQIIKEMPKRYRDEMAKNWVKIRQTGDLSPFFIESDEE